ncbi:MAG: DM13 domain-containing protein [Thermosynechococcaceae cyanobacterium]
MGSLNHIATVSLVSMLTFGTAVPFVQPAIAQQAPARLTGAFVGVDHPTKGNAYVINKSGKSYLVLDKAFQSHEGPDLFVLLHRSGVPETYTEQNYVSLGRLQNVNGPQWYEIPSGVNPTDYKSVVVWCREFNVTFGYAPFKS